MKLFWRLNVVCLWALCSILCSCDAYAENPMKSNVSFVSWNVQTFFDAVNDGCEYAEFRKSKNWSEEKYLERLQKLCSVIKELDADVYVMQEIENEAVLHDICNMLAGSSWNLRKTWNFSCFAKPDGSAIGCAVLSRYEISEMKVHDLKVQVLEQKQPSMRYLMQVRLNFGGEELVLFVNHWKSKSGGEAKSDVWRDWQESILAARVIELELSNAGRLPVVACGDFNRDIREFVYASSEETESDFGNILLRSAGFEGEECINVYSPWFSDNGNLSFETGSYFYQKNWEYIDQVFCNDLVRITEFEPCQKEPWATAGGIPFSYKIYSGQGYSDHLPIKFKIEF